MNEKTPRTFLVQAQNDSVPIESSLFYWLALKNAKVPAELHVFPTGGHGYGLRRTSEPITEWPLLAEKWMKSQGLLSR